MNAKAFGAGAAWGAVVWGIYAVVEEAFSSLRPMIGRTNPLVLSWHWAPVAKLFAGYLVVGLLIGGFCGLLARKTSLLPVVTLTVVAAFALNLASHFPLSGAESATLCTSLLLAAALIARIVRPRLRQLAYVCEPWSAFVLLLGVHWICYTVAPRNSVASTVVHSAALLFAALIAGFVTSVWFNLRRHALAVLAAVPVIVGSMLLLNRDVAPIGPAPVAASADRPNILLVTLDTVWARHMSLYGYERETTPQLEKLAARATLYMRATAASNSTLPTHASIFTGTYARRHGAHFFGPEFPDGRPLAPESRTLAEILAGAGYRTLAVVANVGYLNSAYGMDQGFQFFDATEPVPVRWVNERQYLRDRLRSLIGLFTSTADFDRATRTAGEITADVLQLLGALAKERAPFFVFVNYMDAHGPYLPPPPFDSKFPGKNNSFTQQQYKVMTHEMKETGRSMTPEEYRHFTSQYDGGISYIDFHLGKLIEHLEELGLYRNTLVIITADHGEAFGENGIVGHSKSVYQTQVFVPLVVKYPGQTQARSVDVRVSQVDLMPTILDAARLDTPPGIDGRSLLQPLEARPIVSEAFPHLDAQPGMERAVFEGDMKLILAQGGKRELYNLAEDPGEQRNLYLENRREASALQAALDTWIGSVPPSVHRPPKTDSRALERLRALGYVQ